MATQSVEVYYPSLTDKQFLKLCPCAGQIHRALFANDLLSPDGSPYLELTLSSGPTSHPLGGIVVTFEYDDSDLPIVDGVPIEVVFPTPGCAAYTVGWPVCVEDGNMSNGVHTFRVELVDEADEVVDATLFAYNNQARTQVDYFYFDSAVAGEGTLSIQVKADGVNVFAAAMDMTGPTLSVYRSDFAAGFITGIFAKDTRFTVILDWTPLYGPSPSFEGLAISPVQRII